MSMSKKRLTRDEIEARFAEIDAMPAEALTPEEEKSLAEAEAINDGSTMTLEEFKKSLEGYSGRTVIRLPRSLHKRLAEAAAIEGISLNQYMIYKLSR